MDTEPLLWQTVQNALVDHRQCIRNGEIEGCVKARSAVWPVHLYWESKLGALYLLVDDPGLKKALEFGCFLHERRTTWKASQPA